MNAPSTGEYIGSELETFRHAVNWKRYFARHVAPYLGESVLEVGAGLGETAPYLCTGEVKFWTFLEPDSSFCNQIESSLDRSGFQAEYTVLNGTVDSIDQELLFDTILYMDVLEHIEQDREELQKAMLKLKPGGCMVVLSPAHQFLFSEFDQSIGHYRRYALNDLAGLCPAGMSVVCRRYLDSLGLFASLANRLLLRQSAPALRQILFWDRVIVRLSRLLDPLLFYRVGKSVLVVYRKD